MYKLLAEIRDCKVCEIYLELGANPIVSASSKSKIVIVGQARGRIVHQTGIKEIAAEINSPEHFLAKILQELSRKDIVKSVKRSQGGFYMDGIALKRLLSEVIEAVDGNGLFTDSGLGLDYCAENNHCHLHNEFKVIRSRIHEMLQCTTIEKFNGDLNPGITTLKK